MLNREGNEDRKEAYRLRCGGYCGVPPRSPFSEELTVAVAGNTVTA